MFSQDGNADKIKQNYNSMRREKSCDQQDDVL